MSAVLFAAGSRRWLVERKEGTSLLDHALAAGVPVNFSCKRGDCAQCVASLGSGEVVAVSDLRPLHHSEGIYLCNALPRGDLVVNLPFSSELADIELVRSPCKIHEIRRLSEAVIEVTLRLPPRSKFKFLPGQYIRLAKGGVVRSYSLSDPPADDALLRIHVKRVPGGLISNYLFDGAAVNDLLHLEGPMGKFFLHSDVTANRTLFCATGTGIAPINAILASLRGHKPESCGDLYLYWGNRRREDAYLRDQLAETVRALGIRNYEVYSEARGCTQEYRYVHEIVARQHPSLAGAQVFAAGNNAMIQYLRDVALRSGLAAGQFHSDAFTAS